MNPIVLFTLKVTGVIVLIIVGSALYIWWLLKKMAAKSWAEYHERMANGGYAPPMRVELDPIDKIRWSDRDKIELTTNALIQAGYEKEGLFEAAAPFVYNILGFKHKELPLYAALKELKHTKEFTLDLFSELSDGTLVKITNATDDGLDYPDFAHTIRLSEVDLSDAEQVGIMHRKIVDETQGEVNPDLADQNFKAVFQHSWAQIMDWRIERGGITTKEVIRTAEISGEPEPSKEKIKQVKQVWLEEIDQHFSNLILQSYLKSLDIDDEERVRGLEHLVIVHERSTLSRLQSAITDNFAEDELQNEASGIKKKLKDALKSEDSMIDAFRQALKLLPEEKQFTLHCSIETPFKSDIYYSPAEIS